MSIEDRISVRLPDGSVDTPSHRQHPHQLPGVLFRFWRWLTCGHGRHAVWQLGLGIGLDFPPPPHRPQATIHLSGFDTLAVRHCPRCGLTEVLE